MTEVSGVKVLLPTFTFNVHYSLTNDHKCSVASSKIQGTPHTFWVIEVSVYAQLCLLHNSPKLVRVNILPKSLVIAVAVQVLSQIFKWVALSIKTRQLRLKHLLTFGGMPSAHSAFVTSLSVAIAVYEGPSSNLFGLAAVFSAIVIFDAYKLRGNVQKQARVVNRLQESLPANQRVAINEMVGHTLPEIVVGILVGLVLAWPAALFWK